MCPGGSSTGCLTVSCRVMTDGPASSASAGLPRLDHTELGGLLRLAGLLGSALTLLELARLARWKLSTLYVVLRSTPLSIAILVIVGVLSATSLGALMVAWVRLRSEAPLARWAEGRPRWLRWCLALGAATAGMVLVGAAASRADSDWQTWILLLEYSRSWTLPTLW